MLTKSKRRLLPVNIYLLYVNKNNWTLATLGHEVYIVKWDAKSV